MNKTIILDSRTSKKSVETLSELGFDIIYVPQNKCFDLPVSAHPDVFITKIKDKWFSDACLEHLFEQFGNIEFCSREIGETQIIKYPYDCSFNCVSLGNFLICNKKITNNEILNFAKETNMNILHTNQGYSKCSICKVNENAIITEDTQIHRIAIEHGINSLLIQKGHVVLDGYEYGFFGGCTGLIENNLLAVNGDISKHPNYKEILEFSRQQKVELINLNNEQLYDIGTVLRFF